MTRLTPILGVMAVQWRESMEALEQYLRGPAFHASRLEFLRILRLDRERRNLEEQGVAYSELAFRRLQQEPGRWSKDPLAIDRYLLELHASVRLLASKEWLRLRSLVAHIQATADETRSLRVALLISLSESSPRNPA